MNRFIKILILSIVFFGMLFPLSVYANPVRVLFEKGVEAYEKNDFKTAIALFENAVKIYPELAPAYNYLGLCQKSLNADVNVVIKFFEKAIEVDPSYVLAYDNLAKIYYGLNNYDKAEQYNLKTIELNPKMLSSYLSLGWINLLGRSDAEEAIYYFEKVTEGTDMPYAYFGLGLANFLNNNNAEVLNIITILRNSGKEALALHLEQMIREKRYIAPAGPGMGGASDKEQRAAESGPPDQGEMSASSRPRPPMDGDTPPDDNSETRMKVRLRKR